MESSERGPLPSFPPVVRAPKRLCVEGLVEALRDRAEHGPARICTSGSGSTYTCRRKPDVVASTSNCAFSDSMTTTISPFSTRAPTGWATRARRLAHRHAELRHAMGVGVGVPPQPISRTVSATRAAVGRVRVFEHRTEGHRGMRGGHAAARAPFSESKPASTQSAATSLAIPQRGGASSTRPPCPSSRAWRGWPPRRAAAASAGRAPRR